MRPVFFVRLGCLGWFFLGWAIFAFYAMVVAAIAAWMLSLWLIAGLGFVFDEALKAIPAYRRRRALRPISWPLMLSNLALSCIKHGTKRKIAPQPVRATGQLR